jgi:hypothetical protein
MQPDPAAMKLIFVTAILIRVQISMGLYCLPAWIRIRMAVKIVSGSLSTILFSEGSTNWSENAASTGVDSTTNSFQSTAAPG